MIFDFFFTSALTILNETSVAFLSCSAPLPVSISWIIPLRVSIYDIVSFRTEFVMTLALSLSLPARSDKMHHTT